MNLFRSLFAFLLLISATSAWAAPVPPPVPTGPGQGKPIPEMTPEQKKKSVAMSCPVKGVWAVRMIKVGVGTDYDFTKSEGDGRYCSRKADLDMCVAYNPTPQFKCRLIDPLLPRASCTLQPQQFVQKGKLDSLAGWSFIDKDNVIVVTPYSCDREYKMESCRYWFQSGGVTVFSNKGLLSVDRTITAQMTTCVLDEAANAEYQKKLAKGVTDLNTLLKAKRSLWDAKCPKFNYVCQAKVANLFKQAEAEAWSLLEYRFDGSGIDTMKFITQKYDPLLAKELGS